MLLLAVSPTAVNRIVSALTRHELSQDPRRGGHPPAARRARLDRLNVVHVALLLHNKLWAYPWMIGFLVVVIGHELYRIS